MEALLTRGAIAQILDGHEPSNPVFQILGSKPLSAEQFRAENQDPKYRLMISDGLNSHQYCIVSNQDIVRDIKAGRLEKFTLIRVQQYKVTKAEDTSGFNKKILYIINLEIFKPAREVGIKLGQPVSHIEREDVSIRQEPPPQAYQPPPQGYQPPPQQYQPPPQQYQPPPQQYQPPPQQYQPPPQAYQPPPQGYQPPQPTSNNYGFNDNSTQPQPYSFASNNGNTRDVGMGGNMPRPAPPSRRENFDMAIIEIASLTPYIGKWTVKGRVLSKGPVRTWSNAKGEGKLFSFELADKTGHIKVTAFSQECDKFHDYVQPNKVYYLSRAMLKAANKKYTTADWEVTLQQDSQLQECTDMREAAELPQQKFHFKNISEITNISLTERVDLIGAIETIEETQTIISKAKKELRKRNLIIVDQSRHSITVTLWGEVADNFKGQVGDIFATKEARISDYGGRTISAGDCILLNPDIPETRKLKQWYDSLIDSNFTSLSTSEQGGQDEWRTLKHLSDPETIRSKTQLFSKARAVVMAVGKSPVYKCCPEEKCGKKLIDTASNEMKCEKCQQTYTHCRYRFKTDVRLSDGSGTIWVTLWDEKAETLLGVKPEEVQRLMTLEDRDLYERTIAAPFFKSYVFVIKSTMDTYNNSERVKSQVLKIEPLDPAFHGSRIIEDIKLMGSSGTA